MSEIKANKYLFKFIIIGDCGVGKTSLMYKFCKDEYHDNFVSTLGVDLGVRVFTINSNDYKLQIWDTADQEKYNTVVRTYYNNANGVIIGYDVSNLSSYNNLSKWLDDLSVHLDGTKNVIKLIVGLKADLHDLRVVSYDEATKFAEQHGCKYMECSSKNNYNVEQVFTQYLDDFVSHYENEVNKISITLQKPKSRKCC